MYGDDNFFFLWPYLGMVSKPRDLFLSGVSREYVLKRCYFLLKILIIDSP